MEATLTSDQLLIPVYINEEIVLDMLAIVEDGFTKVSQVSVSGRIDNSSEKAVEAGGSASLINKLLSIDMTGKLAGNSEQEESQSITNEKVHTNTSLLSKLKTTLENNNLLQKSDKISDIEIGSFIEIEGELQKTPLIDYMDKVSAAFRLNDIFSDNHTTENKKNAQGEKYKNQKIEKQVEEFSKELKNSGTMDFILTHQDSTIVLSVQNQYIENDNISELLGGTFKVLGKVISTCKSDSESIDLLRKTALSIFSDEMIDTIIKAFNSFPEGQFNLPKLDTKINGPAAIIIPIAIYI